MTTPEGLVKIKVKKALDALGVYYFMPVPMGLSATTLDYLCCYHGMFFGIETKVPKKKLTPRQHVVASAIVKAGGFVLVIRDADDVWHMDRLLKNRMEVSAIYDTLEGRQWPL